MTTVTPALAHLTPEERRQLLVKMRRESAPAQVRDYPLSWNQEGLWLLEKMERGRGHIMSAALRLSGPLDIEALRGAHADIAARHDILRTTFHDVDGQAVQRVHADGGVAFSVIESDESSFEAMLERCAGEPFDLSQLPLLRSFLLRLGPEEHVWLLTAHHIIFDGWSVGVFVRDIAAAYEARLRGQSARLAPLPLQYAAYAGVQRSEVETGRMNRDLAWWKEQLKEAPEALDLPFDRNRGPRLSENGAVHFFQISAVAGERLQALAAGAGATLYMALLTVFSALLARYGGQDDLVVGTPAANRGRPEREPAIGFFVSALPLRIRLGGRPSFLDLLRRVKETCVQAFVHQDVPFERIVKELKIPRDASRNPLFQTMFGLRNMDTTFQLQGLRATPLRVNRTTSQFDLTLLLKETPEGIEGAFEYSTDLFDAATVERMGRHFRNLLDAIVADPSAVLCDIDFLTPEERRAQGIQALPVIEAVDPVAEFEEAVRKHPDKPAIEWEGGAVTYAELNRRANQVAVELARLGAGVETLVGLNAMRNPSAIAGLLGILKVGAAFLPLDPDYPAERIAFMAADSGIRLIVSNTEQTAALSVPLVQVRTDQATNSPFAAVFPDPECLAYVIYTSGSTGRPKGVAISRNSLAHFCSAARDTYPIHASDRILQFASLSFDTALEEIVPCLISGATLVLRTDAMLEEPGRLLDACRIHGITVLNLPTSWWRRMTAEMIRLRVPLPDSVRTIIIGGEACSREALQSWRDVDSRATRLLNTYGPTETCVAASMADLLREENHGGREISIGTRLGNAQLLVVDSNMRPVPFGVRGELLIGGPGVARGYVGRAGLTAERFIPPPIATNAGARMYRTGDLVRLRPGGDITYAGRSDNQVKIHGHRIEPGEVEDALCAFTDVNEALVTVSGDRLIAYITTVGGAAIEIEMVRRFLRNRLPYFAVPAQIHVVAELSKLPNGKIDRKRIPTIESRGSGQRKAPTTAIQLKIAAIWQAILRVENVATGDNFFSLGGDSIMTIQVASRAMQQGLPITSRDIFEHQTIAELAAEVESRLERSVTQPVEWDNEPPGPHRLSPIQEWFFSRNYARPSHFNQSVLLEIGADIDVSRLADAVRTVFARHDAFRLRFRRDGDAWIQTLASSFDPDTIEIVERIDTGLQRRLDIEAGPVVRAAVMPARSGASGRLLVVAHHLVIDAVSWRILVEEVTAAYAGNPLPPGTRPFTAWPRSLAQHASSLSSERIQLWMEQPHNPPPLPLDFDALPEANTVDSREQVSISLGPAETEILLRNTLPALDARMDEAVLAACVESLLRWMGAETLLIDLENHGRPELAGYGDFSRTVGWFTSLYPVCVTPADYGLEQVFRAVRRSLRAIPGGGVDYGVLRYLSEDAKTRAKLAAMPGAEVSFNYLGRIDSSLQHPFTAIAPESHGESHDPGEMRSHAIEITALIDGGELRLEWNYSRALHRRETIQAVAETADENLRALLATSRQPRTPDWAAPRSLHRSIVHTRKGAQ